MEVIRQSGRLSSGIEQDHTAKTKVKLVAGLDAARALIEEVLYFEWFSPSGPTSPSVFPSSHARKKPAP